MNYGNALVRATRTGLQTLAAAIIAFPTVTTVADIRSVASPAVLALYTAVVSFVVTFIQNLVEEKAGNPVPK